MTVSDGNGCTATDNVTINENAVVSVTESITDVSCNGDSDGAIDITPAGGTGAGTYTFNWVDVTGNGTVAGDEDQNGLIAGDYAVTVTDANGCSVTASYTINENTALSVTEVITDVTVFGGSDGEIDVTASGGTGAGTYNYNWADNTGSGSVAGDEDQTGLTAGTYDFTVSDANGCTWSTTYTVTQPGELIVDDSIVDVTCNGGHDGEIWLDVSQGTTPYTYNWVDGTGSGSVAANEDQTGLTAGTYDVTVSDANGGNENSKWLNSK